MHQFEKPPIRDSLTPEVSVEASGPDAVMFGRDDIFFAAIETTRMPMLVTDPRQPDNPIIFANRAFLSMSGYGKDEIIGRNCRFLQGPDTDRVSVAALREAIHERREFTTEILNYRKDGSTFWNALFVSPVFNHAKELVYFFASQLDVSRRRDAEEALGQAQKMEALGQLTGGISHDFNNLLQLMMAHLDLLDVKFKRGTADPAALSQGLAGIRKAVSKASTLTQQLLAFSRKQQLEGRSINLNAVVEGIGDMVDRTLGDNIAVERRLAASLANCQLDPTQLEVALLNVLVNARDAMPDGGALTIATMNLRVSDDDVDAHAGLPTGDYVALEISDTGSGIPPEIIRRVMDPFFTTKEEGKGTGLGLSMVYGFVKQSGGTVRLSSEPGAGTTVRMVFPATAAVARSSDLAHIDRRPVAAGGQERVLVVDDRVEVADLSRTMLEGFGYTVLTAHGGKEALDLVDGLPDDEKPALLFSDLIMPGGINGYALARELRRRVPGLKVLLTTGYAGTADSESDGPGPEFDILKKPFRLADLGRRVRMVLDGPTGSDRPLRVRRPAG